VGCLVWVGGLVLIVAATPLLKDKSFGGGFRAGEAMGQILFWVALIVAGVVFFAERQEQAD
jgi:hypothetical protein